MFTSLQSWAKKLKKQVVVLYLAYKDSRTPWYAKAFAMCVVAYAFSPIDLIPDFIPLLGYLDDLVLIPIGVALALKMLPAAVLRDCTQQAEERLKGGKPKNWVAGILIILVWLLVFLWVCVRILKYDI